MSTTRRGLLAVPWLIAGLVVLGGCASTPEEEAGQAQVAPEDCEVVTTGTVRIPAGRMEGRGGIPDGQLRARGLVGLRNVRNVYAERVKLGGQVERVLVAWEGIGLRWNHPSCERRSERR